MEGRTLLSGLTVAQENQLPGTPQSQWDISPASGDSTLQGFATDMSVNRGETVSFKITDTTLAPYRIDIYRMGYYQGNGARLVGSIADAQTVETNQPAPITDTHTGLIDCGNWSVSASWQVPADATSGIYFAKLVRLDNGGASQIVFVVRDDDGHSDMLFQTSDATWQAYNSWGGNSLYRGSSDYGGRAVKVSYNRPFNTRSTTPMGRDFVFGPEFAMVRFLESNGYDVSYFSNIDTARRGYELKEHRVFMSVGHDEYWSAEMRNAAEAARDAGVNMAFLSGNEVYWKTRWENAVSADGTPYRTMVSYKETKADAKIDPSPLWTGTWRDPRFSPPADARPENSLTGQFWTVNRGPGGDTGTPFTVPAEFSGLRFWRNTSVANLGAGQTATLGDIVLGYEWDEDVDNGSRPAGLIQMSRTTQSVPEKMQDYGSTVAPDTATHTLTLYRASSGALVFGAGTVQWSYGLDGTHDGLQTIPDPAMRQATVNLFADMGVQPATLQPGLLRATISTDLAAPTTTISSPASSATVMAGSTVTVTGTASDVGGVVGGVEVSTDGGVTWHRATGRNTWSYGWIPDSVGPATLLARAADDSGNLQTVFNGVNLIVAPQPTSTAGLVGAWGFNAGSGGTVADSSGQGNTGTISGAAWTTGKFGGGLLFNGTSDWVTVPDANSLDLTTGMTLEAWVKPTASGTWRNILLKEQTGGLAYGLYASNTAGFPTATANITFDRTVTSTAALPMGAWSHVAATYDGSVINFYVNGALIGSRNQTGPITTSAGALRFGGNSVWGEYFQGSLDEIRIYNRPLNAGEIHVDMSTPVGGSLESTFPAASFSSPASGSSVSGDTTLTVAASDNVAVSQVEFYRNGVLMGAPDTTAPYTFVWRTAQFANGSYTITARAKDFAGNAFTTAPITLNVNNAPDATAPAVELKQPRTSSLVSGSIPLWATASDNIAVAGVRFKVDGANVGSEDVSAPFQFLLDTRTLADGTHTVTAVARDAAGNLTTSAPISISVDNTVPVLVAHTPASGATGVSATSGIQLTFSKNIDPTTVQLELRNAASQLVPGTVTYDSASHVATFTPNTVLALGAAYTATLVTARDFAGNPVAGPITWSYTTSTLVANVTIWGPTATPATLADADSSAIELGLRFSSEISGYVTGVRFYKGAGNVGTHTGRLWTGDGQLLGSVTFANETDTGWQQANFVTPIPITAGVAYVISYHTPVGRYSSTQNYFATGGYDGGLLEAPANTATAPNGIYRYGAGGVFPTSTFKSSNYWVDAVFANNLADATPPSLIGRSPAPAETGVDVNGNVTATLSEDVQNGTVSFVLRDGGGSVVPASVAYDPATRTATLDPSSALAYNATYTATVSGATDAAGNTMASASWSFTTATGPDLTPPSVLTQTPTPSASNVQLGSNVTATFSEAIDPASLLFQLRDASNQLVTANVTYNAATRTATLDPVSQLAYLSSYSASARAADPSGNLMPAAATWSFVTEAPVTGASLWPATTVPATPAANDAQAVEVGVKIQASADGYITALRFYKGAGNTGTHVGHLWTSTGTLLATITFTGESDTGWQSVDLNTPVPVTAGQTYVASYYAPAGRYAVNTSYFSASGTTSGPLTALRNGQDGGNGVYRYGVGGGFPTTSGAGANYWVDVVYSNSLPPDVTSPVLTTRSPAPGATNVARNANVTATFSEPVRPETVVLEVRDASSNLVAGALSYDANSRTMTFDPTGSLAYSGTYTVNLSGAADAAGNVMSGVTWSFTVVPPIIGATIWPNAAAPTTPASTDSAAVEVGVKFRTTEDGYITGIRFYKGVGNTGTHVGHLWDSSGNLLASVTFTSETDTGWQQATFAAPVAVTAGQTYVASYYAPVGRYAADARYFTNAGTASGPLTALRNGVDGGNGVYRYGAGGGFPSSSYNASNYWVDVVYASVYIDNVAPGVTRVSPGAGTSYVPLSANVKATFNEAVQAPTISMVLRDASNNPVPAAVTYDAATRSVTLDPAADLVDGATYTVTLSGAQDTAGNTMSPLSWSFTASAPIVNASFWNNATVPAVQATADTKATEVGVKFVANTDGYITGIRFYKGVGNTGTHVGHLWDSAGNLLASVTFTSETDTGWQQATFAAPVAVTAGQTYVASYYAPVGRYAATAGYFTGSTTTNGALTALTGVYKYAVGGGYPTTTYQDSNYWVDVLFSTVVAP